MQYCVVLFFVSMFSGWVWMLWVLRLRRSVLPLSWGDVCCSI